MVAEAWLSVLPGAWAMEGGEVSVGSAGRVGEGGGGGVALGFEGFCVGSGVAVGSTSGVGLTSTWAVGAGAQPAKRKTISRQSRLNLFIMELYACFG